MMNNNALQLMILQQLIYSSNDKDNDKDNDKYIDKDIPTRSMILTYLSDIQSDDTTDQLLSILVPTISKSDIVSYTTSFGTVIISTKDAILYYQLTHNDMNAYFKQVYSDNNLKNVKFSQHGIFKYNNKWYYPIDGYLIKKSGSDDYEVVDNVEGIHDDSIIAAIPVYKEPLILADTEQLLYKSNEIVITNGNGKTHIDTEGYGEYVIDAYDENSRTDISNSVICISIGTEIYVVSLEVIYNEALQWQFTNPIERIVMEDEHGRIKKFNSDILTIQVFYQGIYLGITLNKSILVNTGNKTWKLSFS